MAIKYREAEELRLTTRKDLTASPENWMQFLKTASYTYKYSYPDQLLISAQFPDATAVASFDVWSDRFGRRIRKGEKGIGLIDNTERYPRMRYVFDISQSDRYRDVPQPYIWNLQEENQNELILSLAGDLSISIEEAVSDFCENTVDSLIGAYENDVVLTAKQSDMLAGLDETAIRAEFRRAVFESVKFMALTRCGLPTDEVDIDAFRNLSAFSDVNITDILGTAVSNISEQALREIETTVKTIERSNQYERDNQEQDHQRNTPSVGRGNEDILSDSERGQGDRFDLYARSRNIRIPAEPDRDNGREGYRNLGNEKKAVSSEKQGMAVSGNVRQSHSDRSSGGSERSGGEHDGRSDGEDDGERGSEREAESGRLDGVGTQSELGTEQSGGNRVQRADLQIREALIYQVITYTNDSGTDEKPEYATLKEAQKAGEKYLADGYDGFAVFNKKENKVEYLQGTFPFDTTFTDEVKRRSYDAYSEYTGQPKKRRTKKTKRKAEERTVSPVFSSFTQGEQISMFPTERTEQDIANEYAMAQIARLGTRFVDSKFRIAEYFAEGHTKQEKAKFLSDKYGTGGYAGGGERMDYSPGKGITMSRTDKDNPENNITVHLTYPQVVDMIDSLISDGLYITPQDIEKRQQRAIYILKTYDPNDPFEAQQIEEAKAVLDSYNIDYSQLLANLPTVETADAEEIEEMNAAIPDDADLPDINAPSVIDEPQDTVYIESAVVAELRNRTTESFHLINGKNEYDIELEVEELLRQEMQENNIAGEITGTVLYGSRSRGLEAAEDADIDIAVQIDGAELKEDALFNIFHDLDIQIDGIPVDVNPIRPEETGTLETYLPKTEAYLEQKQAERAEQVFSSSDGENQDEIDEYLIDDPVITIDKYNFTIDFDSIREISFVSRIEEYIGGLDSDGHERKDNFGVSEEETSFGLVNGYLYAYNTDFGTDTITKEGATEDIESLIDKAITAPDMSY